MTKTSYDRNMRISAFEEREVTLKVARALASVSRLSILALLVEGPMSLAEVQARLNLGRYRSTVYRHLETLKAAGLVKKEYDDETKALRYRVSARRIELDLRRT